MRFGRYISISRSKEENFGQKVKYENEGETGDELYLAQKQPSFRQHRRNRRPDPSGRKNVRHRSRLHVHQRILPPDPDAHRALPGPRHRAHGVRDADVSLLRDADVILVRGVVRVDEELPAERDGEEAGGGVEGVGGGPPAFVEVRHEVEFGERVEADAVG